MGSQQLCEHSVIKHLHARSLLHPGQPRQLVVGQTGVKSDKQYHKSCSHTFQGASQKGCQTKAGM